jgi:hypothetical protein
MKQKVKGIHGPHLQARGPIVAPSTSVSKAMAVSNSCGRLHALLQEQCKMVGAVGTRVLGDEFCTTVLFSAPNVKDSVQLRHCPAPIGERTGGEDQMRESHDAPSWERTESALSAGSTPKSESPLSNATFKQTAAQESSSTTPHMAQCADDQQLLVRHVNEVQTHVADTAGRHIVVGVDQDDDDCGVGTCLPGFRRVQRRWGWNEEWGEMLSPPRLLSLENARSEMARRASAALCYSTELIKSQGGLARESLCAVFRKTKSADELDQEKLMELFLHAVEIGSVKISRQEDEPSFQ